MKRVCLLNGRHTPDSDWERECPLRNAAERSERARKAAHARYGARQHAVEQRRASEVASLLPNTVEPDSAAQPRPLPPGHPARPIKGVWESRLRQSRKREGP